jgi:Tfp pilus assembly protein PilF
MPCGKFCSFLLCVLLISSFPGAAAAQQPPVPPFGADLEERITNHHLLGVRYLNEKKPEQAAAEFEAAAELAPTRGLFHALLGAAQEAAGHRDAAIRSFRRALELEPEEASHHNNLGVLLAREGKLEEAAPHFDQAARLDPGRAATFRYNRGAALLNAGRAAEAVGPLRQATKDDRTMAVAHFYLGVALFRTSPRVSTAGGGERIEPRGGTVKAFQRYLQLEPNGSYAEAAREFLRRLGSAPPSPPSPARKPA